MLGGCLGAIAARYRGAALEQLQQDAHVERVEVQLPAQQPPQVPLQQEARDALQRPVRRAAQHGFARCG